jgi:hypothetical protein
MTVAGWFYAIITDTTFTKLERKLNFACMTYTKKKAVLNITTP